MDQLLIALYQRVFSVVEYFLAEAEPVLTIASLEKLKAIDPTVGQMAKTLRKLHAVIGVLANDSYEQEEIKINALQCVVTMEQIAVGMENSDIERVMQLISELEKLKNAPRIQL